MNRNIFFVLDDELQIDVSTLCDADGEERGKKYQHTHVYVYISCLYMSGCDQTPKFI